MSKIPAITTHAHYLFEDGVLEFDTPVEIHVTRFGPNQMKMRPDLCPYYPKYQVKFEDPTAFKVYINTNEAYHSPNRENLDSVIENSKQYDLILTHDEPILKQCENSVFFPYGTTWLNTGHIDHHDGLGVFDEEYVKPFWENKKYEISFLCANHNRTLDGYDLRKDIWTNQKWLKPPLKFYNSIRHPVPDEDAEMLPDDKKDHLFHSQFSITIENCSVKNYFTEKLIDCFLTKTVPIYFGCENIKDFFDARGMILVPDGDVKNLIQISNTITDKTYENMKPYIEENYKRAKEYARSFAERVKEKIEESMTEKQQNEEQEKLLSIGILTLEEEERKALLNRLLSFLSNHTSAEDMQKVEILVNIDDGSKSVGLKRNEILERANGKFICFVDDDDLVDQEYVATILRIIEENEDLDCIGFQGMYYIDEEQKMLFKHANKYGGHYRDGFGVQYRPTNHLNPVRTELAKQVRFPEKDFGEDSDYCDKLYESGLLKNEVIIEDKIMYHYFWSEKGTRTHK